MDNASWVIPQNFDPEKISIATSNTSDTFERLKVLYKYRDNYDPKDLILTVPRVPEAYIKCKGVKKDTYQQGDKRIETNRYGAQFVLSGDNKFHNELYSVFLALTEKIKELTNCEVIFPSSDIENITLLYTNIIHSNDGRMFSTAYTNDEQVLITDCRQCITRPAFLVTLLKKSNNIIKLRLQVSQMFIYDTIKEFPLANVD